ncbi:hypothetical protein [Bdellovibrio sp. HCB2-146]|uniref:hypothetical protein n=1 Tax=Bdellovibrio sp. HCB2-146 TaxID=3394362 RepID=UPI0039BCEF53
MKPQKLFSMLFAFLFLISFETHAAAAKTCEGLFGFRSTLAKANEEVKTEKSPSRRKSVSTTAIEITAKPRTALPEDAFIAEYLGKLDFSYAFFGQKQVSAALYNQALGILSTEGLTISGIQKAHRALTDGKATLKFRDSNDARVIGSYSFKGFSILNPTEVRNIKANPFLSFKPTKELTKIGVIDKENLQIGEIFYPNHETADRFFDLLSKDTQGLVKDLKSRQTADPEKSAAANTAILNDLLTWSLNEAEVRIKNNPNEVPQALAMLEWRVKSLGLYFESIFSSKASHIESSMGRLGLNRNNELAEAIVDTFIAKHKIVASLDRGFRPKVSDSFAEWTAYMQDAVQGVASAKTAKLVKELKDLSNGLSREEALIFESYYQTVLMTGNVSSKTTSESIFNGYKDYVKTHYNKDIPETARVLLVPTEFIKNFETLPESFKNYLEQYYFTDATLFRGVSNPWALTDGNILQYFKSYKGRFASEVARSIFDDRVELTKHALLQFNADLIAGRVVETAAQHAAKHMGYTAPNSAKTYFVSAADLSTIAFRFAMDKGYVDRSSSVASGTTHMVFEFLQPKYGVVDFSSFKLTDPTWKNYFPRQHETSIAGGMDPNGLKRIYILQEYAPGDKIPVSGPEKHGRIIKIFERDDQNPLQVNIKLKNKAGEWVNSAVIDLKGKIDDN